LEQKLPAVRLNLSGKTLLITVIVVGVSRFFRRTGFALDNRPAIPHGIREPVPGYAIEGVFIREVKIRDMGQRPNSLTKSHVDARTPFSQSAKTQICIKVLDKIEIHLWKPLFA
jgi:hypothetical protein